MSKQFKLEHKVVQSSDGTPIYAEAIGDPSKPAIIMVHGMAICSATYDNLFLDSRMLNAVYMVRYDLRGHGRSGKPTYPEAYVSSLWAEDYKAVMRAFNLKKHIFMGWSYGGCVVNDICACTDPIPLAGVVWMAPLPYVGPIMSEVGTSVILGFLPGLSDPSNGVLNIKTRIDFVDSLVNDANALDFNVKMSMLGQTMLLPPEVVTIITSRRQDPKMLFDRGEHGLPLLLLYGTNDKQVKGEVVKREIGPHFEDFEVCAVEGGGHALLLEYLDQVVEPLLAFMKRVMVRMLTLLPYYTRSTVANYSARSSEESSPREVSGD